MVYKTVFQALLAALLLLLPLGFAQADDAQEAFYIGADQHVHHFYAVPGSSWAQEDLTTVTGAVSAAPGSSLASFEDVLNNTQNVFYLGTDQHVHQLYAVPGSPWAPYDITAATGAVAAAGGSPLASFEDVLNNTQNVFYIGTDQHVHQLFAVPGSPWTSYDITAGTGAVSAASGSSLASFEDVLNNTQNVFYIGTDQHVHQFYASPGYSSWAPYDITAATGAVAAASGSSLTSFEDVLNNTQNVFYIGTDQHVHQFYASPGYSSWASYDLSAATGAVAAASGSSPTSFEDVLNNTQNVFYIGTDQHVHQFYAAPGYSSWAPYDITAATGAVAAAGVNSLASFEDVVSNIQNVFYVGTDQHVHQFYAVPGYSWASYDINAATGAVAAATDSPLNCWSTQGAMVKVTGTVLAGGTGFSGVTLSLTGASASGVSWSQSTVTDGNGSYQFFVPFGGNYTVTPSAGDYTFDPPSANFSNLNAAQTANFTGYINGASTNPSTPDPGPAPYPNYLSSVPTSSGTLDCGNLSGTWTESSSSSPSTWSLTQNGNLVAGTMTNTDSSCGQTIVWQVTGSTNGGSQYSLSRGNPNPSMACGDVVDSANVSLTVNSCTSGVASNTLIAPQGYYFASTGTNTEPGENTTWSRSAAPTYSLASASQMPIPSLPNNAQMIPISITDNPQLTTTASVSGYSFNVNYSAQFLGNPHSSCQASQVTLSIPSASGTSSASSNISATSGCGGVFTVSGLIGQASTQNALYVVAPPDILVRELWGEANRQASVGDQVSELAIGNAIRQRFGDKQYFATFNYYEDMNVGRYNQGFDGLNRCPSGCLSGIATQHSTETLNAAYIYGGINTPATDVANSRCFISPTPADWQKISAALQTPTTVLPGPLVIKPGCFTLGGHTQLVYKPSIGRNAGYKDFAPAFVFEQWRETSDPSVIQLPE